jgi:hypothetical protein
VSDIEYLRWVLDADDYEPEHFQDEAFQAARKRFVAAALLAHLPRFEV